ncbi:MAG: hypothetical protein ACT6FG_00050 [Methanosarcinaceae archaeon]
MVSKMPKIETLKRHFQDYNLTDDKLMEIAEWLRKHLKKEHISTNSKLLEVIIAWESR